MMDTANLTSALSSFRISENRGLETCFIGVHPRSSAVSIKSQIGVVLLVAGSVGALTTVIPVSGVILILAAMGLAGAVLSARLPEVAQS